MRRAIREFLRPRFTTFQAAQGDDEQGRVKDDAYRECLDTLRPSFPHIDQAELNIQWNAFYPNLRRAN